jgi:hypothetical protein
MKRKFSKNSKRSMAIVLSAAMMLSGLTMPVDASAKQTQEQEREDNTIVYAVDCGDINPETAPEDGPL